MDSHRMFFNIIAKRFILGISIFILLSCNKRNVTQNTKQITAQKNVKEVNWIAHWSGEGKRQQLVEEIAKEFEFKNQDIKINLFYPETANKDGGGDSVEISFMANEVLSQNPKFDIIRLKDYYPQIAKKLKDPDWGKKYLVDFSEFPDFVEKHQSFLFDDEYKNLNGGITIGPYNEGFYWTIWYNKAVADKMGIKVKQTGMTGDDLVGYIKTAHEYIVKNNSDVIPYFEEGVWLTSEMVMFQLFYSAVGDLNELKKPEFDPKKLQKLETVLNVFAEMSKYEPTFKDRSKISWWSTTNYPLEGKCLFYVQGSWMYNIWEKKDKELLKNMYPAELPTINGSAPCYIGGYKACWAVLKNAPHKEEAIKLMKYWANPEVAENWVRSTKCPTGIKGNLTSTTIGFDQFEDFQYNLSKKYGQNMITSTDNRYIFGMRNRAIKIPFIDIMEKRKTVAQVMAEIRRQITYEKKIIPSTVIE